MDTYDSRRETPRKNRTTSSRARERQQAREQRRRDGAMAVPLTTPTLPVDTIEGDETTVANDADLATPLYTQTYTQPSIAPTSRLPSRRVQRPQLDLAALREELTLWRRDAWWYITHRPYVARGIAVFALALFAVFTMSHIVSGRIFPNIWVLGVHVGELTTIEAAAAIRQAWTDEIKITLLVDGEDTLEIAPSELGLQIDAEAAARDAKALGMSGIPFGYSVAPTLTLQYQTAQTYLLDLAQRVNLLPFNAGYAMDGTQVVGIDGRNGRELDIAATLDFLQANITDIVRLRRLDVLTLPIPPDILDPSPFLDEVQTLVSQQFALIGYDPFTDTSTAWSTSPEVIVSWLEAGASRLTVRESTFKTFVETLNTQIKQTDPTVFIDTEEAYQMVDDAIAELNPNIYLRLKHYPTEWTVRPDDTGFRIARYSGIPFFMIQEVNPGRDWEKPLSVGEKINLPSVDLTLPNVPVPNKRIIVDLDNQLLVAFENRQEVFRWKIASGMYNSPTSPGIYQVLNHEELAYGSSYTLCGDAGCAQWKMWWFMGMYEVYPGMMNGFHGWVELPDGALLGDGNVGVPATFGCVMSDQDNAKALYDWAELGTVVEIVSSEYEPRSDLARKVYNPPTA